MSYKSFEGYSELKSEFLKNASKELTKLGYPEWAMPIAVDKNIDYFAKNRFSFNERTIKHLKEKILDLKEDFILEAGEDLIYEDSLSYSRNLAGQLNFRVKKVREELFNSPNPLFESTEDAVSWIKEQAEVEPKDVLVKIIVDEETLKNLKNYPSMSDPITEKTPITLKAIGIKGFEAETIGFPGKNGWVERLSISSQGNNPWASILARLKAQAKSLTKITGWQEQQAVMHILTGKIPLLPYARIKTENKNFQAEEGWSHLKYANVTFFNPYMTREELIKLHTKIREHLGLKHLKKIQKSQMELVDFVREKSRNYQFQDSVSFWQWLADELAKEEGQKPVKSNSFYKRYMRVCEKLGVTPVRFKKQS